MNAADTTEDRVAMLHGLLNDAATKVGQQRKTISELREALKSARAWVGHWQDDVACNLKPTRESLAQAHAELTAAIANTGEAK